MSWTRNKGNGMSQSCLFGCMTSMLDYLPQGCGFDSQIHYLCLHTQIQNIKLEMDLCPSLIAMQVIAWCFQLLLWDVVLVRSQVGSNFQPVYGISANPALRKLGSN